MAETLLAPFLIIAVISRDRLWETTWELLQVHVRSWLRPLPGMYPDFLWVPAFLLDQEIHGKPQGKVRRSSWYRLMTKERTRKAAWVWWKFQCNVIPSRHICDSLK